MDNFFIIVGLGNPGRKYEGTRHNMGFDTIDKLAKEYSIKVNKNKFKALYGEGRMGTTKVILVKPQTFMNLSGESVRDIVEWYKVPLSNLILIFDDIDIGLGEVRIKRKGSAGSHNGMKSVIYQLADDEFPRVKIGVGAAPTEMDLADYVMSHFSRADRKIIDESIDRAAKAVQMIVDGDIDEAMNEFN